MLIFTQEQKLKSIEQSVCLQTLKNNNRKTFFFKWRQKQVKIRTEFNEYKTKKCTSNKFHDVKVSWGKMVNLMSIWHDIFMKKTEKA